MVLKIHIDRPCNDCSVYQLLVLIIVNHRHILYILGRMLKFWPDVCIL